ncbi:calcium/sodium antiporter [Limibacter armeniacum]|uniref:calcium/sodium antiporter n=1 Tax=Limibacter armeniacum TaxID=466084 RepID=UPI002FE5E6BD
MLTYVLFVIGFVLLIKGADYLVEGASSIAKRYQLSELVIGLTIVSFGTSMPELIVNLLASFEGSAELAIGNVFGSNIANVLLILGFSAIVRPLPIQRSIYFTEIPISLVATFMVGFLANANLFTDGQGLSLSRFDGGMLLLFFALFMFYIAVIARSKDETENEEEEIALLPMGKSLLLIGAGVLGLFVGGKWIVDGAVVIASALGFSETFIGLTVVAIGTSLPELVTSVVAARKGKADIAVGNVIGSNIFNILWILGISALIRPLPFDIVNNMDILTVIFSSTMLLFAVIVGRKPQISRATGYLFVFLYIAYLVYLVQRG